jgi:hypothetical protein
MARSLSPDWGVWSLASPKPVMPLLLAGTPFESLTALREIEGVARPRATLKTESFVGSATVPTNKRVREYKRDVDRRYNKW